MSALCGAPVAGLGTRSATAAADDSARIRFAVVGDFGSLNQHEADVANLIDSWGVDFVVTTGDHYYLSAGGSGGNGLDQFDNAVGKYYCQYLKDTGVPNSGTLDCPARRQSAAVNRFFPSIGNHDRTDTDSGTTDYLNCFSLPGAGFENSSGNERYYDFVQGPVHFLAIDADTARLNDDDMAAQKAWLRYQLANSTAPWQVVFFHQSAYSSASHGSDPVMQWPFAEWGQTWSCRGTIASTNVTCATALCTSSADPQKKASTSSTRPSAAAQCVTMRAMALSWSRRATRK